MREVGEGYGLEGVEEFKVEELKAARPGKRLNAEGAETQSSQKIERRNWNSEGGNWGGQDRDGLIELRDVAIKPGFIERNALDAEEYLAPLGMTAAGKGRKQKAKAEGGNQKPDPSPRFAPKFEPLTAGGEGAEITLM